MRGIWKDGSRKFYRDTLVRERKYGRGPSESSRRTLRRALKAEIPGLLQESL